MADKKISALTGATTPLAGTEVLPIVQGSATVKVSVANLTAGRAVAMAGGSFTDNITQSTAAKGVNFTANTPAAGMTSQLLNWYEEGTWTPVFTNCGTASASVAKYTRIGRLVSIQLVMSATTITANSSRFTLPLASSCITSGTFTNGTTLGGFVEVQASTVCYFATSLAGSGIPNVNITYSV